ncbi:hypothetical protein BLOT_003966 [Blomia tropicalis]|nr:hypothetical protein BLOT_003966 [Blomia tropicalis]
MIESQDDMCYNMQSCDDASSYITKILFQWWPKLHCREPKSSLVNFQLLPAYVLTGHTPKEVVTQPARCCVHGDSGAPAIWINMSDS